MKKILFLTGTRADFGKLKSLMHAVNSKPEFNVYIFATGMHMLAKYGNTIDEIRKEGFTRIFPYFNQIPSTSINIDMILANTIIGLGHYVREIKPDLIVIHGDRVEALAGAIVGTLNGIKTAHVEGGELSGTIDEIIRHAVTKLSHVHFTANEETRKRLLQLGESAESVFMIGSPDIDIMLSDSLPPLHEVMLHYKIDFKNYGIFIYHPVYNEVLTLHKNIDIVVDALLASNLNCVVIHPNNDYGSDSILHAFERLKDNPRFRLFPSMRFEFFLTMLKHADVIMGNSSSGIHEAPVYGVPTINIGTRQNNRSTYKTIMNVPENANLLLDAIKHIPQKQAPSFHFGEGKSAMLFSAILQEETFWDISLQKQFKDNAFSALHQLKLFS